MCVYVCMCVRARASRRCVWDGGGIVRSRWKCYRLIARSQVTLLFQARLPHQGCFRRHKYKTTNNIKELHRPLLLLVKMYIHFLVRLQCVNLYTSVSVCPSRLIFTWWGCYGLRKGHKPTEHAHSFFLILFLCLFLSLWPFQLYSTP